MPLQQQLDHILWLATASVAHAESQAVSPGGVERDQGQWSKPSFSTQKQLVFLCLFGVSSLTLQERDADSA